MRACVITSYSIHYTKLYATSLYELGRGLTGSTDLNALLSTVYEELRRAIAGDRLLYYQYDDSRKQLNLVLNRRFDESYNFV